MRNNNGWFEASQIDVNNYVGQRNSLSATVSAIQVPVVLRTTETQHRSLHND